LTTLANEAYMVRYVDIIVRRHDYVMAKDVTDSDVVVDRLN